MRDAIELRNGNKIYRRCDVSFAIAEFVTTIGHSGCGKATLDHRWQAVL